jgi:enoyl-CoA hydratase
MPIQLDIADRVACVTIDREERRNALDNEALDTLIATFEGIRREDVTAVVLTGKGTKAFCAGSDLKALTAYSERDAQHHTYLFQKYTELMDEFPRATIAAIEGFCLGGGLELALTCDYRFASAESEFGFPEITFNALPTGGGTIRAPRAIGLARAREMLLFGFRIDARKAMAWNLVSELVPAGTALEAAMAMARSYAAKVDPFSVTMLKSLLMGGYGTASRVGQTMAYLADCALTQSESFKRGVAAKSRKPSEG